MRRSILLGLLALTACDTIKQPATMVASWTTAWREVATDPDRAKLRNWRSEFVSALRAAEQAGNGALIRQEGALLLPDAALPMPAIRNGIYRCRVIKLGAQSGAPRTYSASGPFECRVRTERNLQRLSKRSGPQRFVGLIFPNDAVRQVVLGTLVLGDERRALQYGQDPARNLAGYLERIGPARWRLILPEPRFESQFDVVELVPVEGVRT